MSWNKSPFAFEDIREAFDRALASPKGIKITCTTRRAAVVLRSRFNYFRQLDRKENAKVYTQEHQLWNRSVYDKLILRIPPKFGEEENVLYIEPHSLTDLNIVEVT